MSTPKFNKYRAAVELLQRGRDTLMDELAETLLDQGEDLLSGGFLFHELIEGHGTRLHFLCLLLSQLEQSADLFDETQAAEASELSDPDPLPDEFEEELIEAPPAPRKRRSKPRSSSTTSSSASSPSTRSRGGKKLSRQSSPEGSPDDA